MDFAALRRVCVFRALKLGDMLCAVPALRALRAALPHAQVVLVGLPWAREFADRYAGYLDGFREFPGYPGLPERTPQVDRLPGFLANMQTERFDLALQLHGSGTLTNPLVTLFGARRTAGFFVPDQFCSDPELFAPYPGQGTEVRRLLSLLVHLGIEPRGEELEFPVRDEDERSLREEPRAAGLRPGEYVCIHPGASVEERRWGPAPFARVARGLAERGLHVVLTGTAGEAELTRAVGRELGQPCVDLAGRTGLGALAALVKGARLLVCNDTGVSHLAAALRVPSVILTDTTNRERWAPADRRRHRALLRDRGAPRRRMCCPRPTSC